MAAGKFLHGGKQESWAGLQLSLHAEAELSPAVFNRNTRRDALPPRWLQNVNHLLDFHGVLVLLLEAESCTTPCAQVRADAWLLQPRGALGRRR